MLLLLMLMLMLILIDTTRRGRSGTVERLVESGVEGVEVARQQILQKIAAKPRMARGGRGAL